MELFRLWGAVAIDNKEADKSLHKTEKKASGLATTLGKGIKTAATWSTAFVGGAGLVGGAMLKAGDKFAETTDRVDKLSQRLGLSREGFQEWEYVLSQSGVAVESMQAGMKSLSQRMGDALEGSGKGAELFEQLGVTITDSMTQEEAFNASITALQNMEDGVKKADLAQQLFGRSGQELLPLLNSTAEGTDELKKRAQELGLVIGDDAIDAGVEYTDTMDSIKRSLGGMVTTLMSAVMPTLQDFLNLVMDNMPMIREVLGNVFTTFGAAVQSIMPFLAELIQNMLPPMIELFTQITSEIMPLLVSLFGTLISEVLPVVLELFTLFVTAVLPPLVEVMTIIINDMLPPLIELFMVFVDTVLPPLIELFEVVVSELLPPLIDLFTEIMADIFPILIDIFMKFTTTVLPPLIDVITLVVKEVLPPLLALFMELSEMVLPLVITVFESLMPIIGPIMDGIAAMINTVLALIKGDWEGAWNGIQDLFRSYLDFIVGLAEGFSDVFVGIFETIGNLIDGVWSGITDNISAAINVIIGGINTFIDGINDFKIPDWVPKVGGMSINLSKIPMLAEGGDITRSGKVMVGEAGPEILELDAGARVTPLKDYKGTEQSNVVQNEFKINQLVVREEADIQKIARELYNMQRQNSRGLGYA